MSNEALSKINKRMIECGRWGGITGAMSGVSGGPLTALAGGALLGAIAGSVGIVVGTIEVIADEVKKSK
jgi:hypothetical protein